MKKRISILISTMCMIVMTAHGGSAEVSSPPDIKVGVALNQASYLPNEPIQAVITLENQNGDIVTSQGFKEKEFHLFLVFIDPDGQKIAATQLEQTELPDPPPPRVLSIVNDLVQVEEVEVVEAGWIITVTLPNAHAYYELTKAGNYSVRAEIPLRVYPGIDYIVGGVEYARIDAGYSEGNLISNTSVFTIRTDADGDGHYYPDTDCDDADPNVHPGAAEVLNNGKDDDCDPTTVDVPDVAFGTIVIQADRHIIGGGNNPGSTKVPIAGLPLRAYDSTTNCVSAIASQSGGLSWKNYPSIWRSCSVPDEHRGETDSAGALSLSLPPGDYLIIGEYISGTGETLYIGRSAGGLQADGVIKKYLQVIEKADGKKVPGKYTKKTGSELLIIEPEYTEWSGTQELYPFVFESVGDWTVTTSVAPPEGFVADHESLTAEVNATLAAVQFTITDVGSKWVETGVVHTIKHKGKTEKVRTKIGIKCAKKLAKEKGFDRFCKGKK